MFNIPLLKQDFKINRGRILAVYAAQLASLLLAAGICEMKLIEISDIFWDTLPVIILPLGMQMMLAYEAIQKRVDDGTMDFVLAAQISPQKMLGTKIMFMVINTILLLGLSTGFGCIFKVYSLTGVWAQETYLLLNMGGFCLQIFWGGFCFMISCSVQARSSYLKLAIGIPVLQYFLYLGYYLIPDLFFLKYLTIFTLFQHDMFSGKSMLVWFSCGLYLILGILFFMAGRHLFIRRNHPQ